LSCLGKEKNEYKVSACFFKKLFLSPQNGPTAASAFVFRLSFAASGIFSPTYSRYHRWLLEQFSESQEAFGTRIFKISNLFNRSMQKL
jgi:hypothetical protein